jgi:hypothetical protein
VRYREGKRARRGFELTSRRANLQVHLVGAEQRPPRQKLRRSGGQLGGGAADERRAGGAARMRRVRAEHGAGLTIGAWARRWGPDSNPTRRGGSSSSRSRAKVRLGKGGAVACFTAGPGTPTCRPGGVPHFLRLTVASLV